MTAHLQASLICRHFVDPADDPTIYRLYHQIFAPAFPTILPECRVVNVWWGDAGTYRESVELIANNGDAPLVRAETEFHLRDDGDYHHVVTILRDVALDPGTYWLRVSVDGTEVTRYPFYVVPLEANPNGPNPNEPNPNEPNPLVI